METKPIQPVEMQMLAERREQLVAVRSSFLKRLNETEDPAAREARDLLVRKFNPVIERALSHIAYSDGLINRKEADVLNALLGQQSNEAHYNSLFRRPEYRTIDPLEQFAVIVDAAIQLGGIEQGIAYDPRADPIVTCFGDLGRAILAADGQMNDLELQCLATYTSTAHAKATALQERMGGLTDGVPADPVPPSPLQEKSPAEREQIERNDKPASLDPIQRCIAELHALVGLGSVKREVETLINLAKVFSIRKERGLSVPEISFHMVFSGNPGTGKTTVARIVAKVYGCLGLLSKGQLVEVDRSGLVANFVGQTATKTRKVIDSAKGGVLFIDEAYALSRETGTLNDFGSEVVEVLLKSMEDYREDLVIIAAGYTDRMTHFLQSNPGLRSRFPRVIEFPDYVAEELEKIFDGLANRDNYCIDDNARPVLKIAVADLLQRRGVDFANAREVRNLYERVVSNQANRISKSARITTRALTTIVEADILQSAAANA